MLPLTAGFLLMGPLSGTFRTATAPGFFSTGGMLVSAIGFAGLMMLPANFRYLTLAVLLSSSAWAWACLRRLT